MIDIFAFLPNCYPLTEYLLTNTGLNTSALMHLTTSPLEKYFFHTKLQVTVSEFRPHLR